MVGRDTEKTSASSLIEYSPVSCIRQSSFCCYSDSFGCFPRSLPFAFAIAMPSAGAHRDEVRFEFGEGGNDVEEHFPHWIGGVMDCGAECEFHASFPQLFGNCTCIRNGAGQTIQL